MARHCRDDKSFPASPSRPQTVFDLRVLRLFHHMLSFGRLSKQAFSKALMRMLEEDIGTSIAEIHSNLLDAYHKYVEFEHHANMKHVKSLGGEELDTEDISQTCPMCTYREDKSKPLDVLVCSGDGCGSHKRFIDQHAVEHEELAASYFIEEQDYPLAARFRRDLANTKKTRCELAYTAARHWRKDLQTPRTMKKLRETGIFAICCVHGCPLKVLDMIRSGERQAHGIALLSYLDQALKPKNIKFMYDVGCVFRRAISGVLPHCLACIGRWHIIGHSYRCSVLFNPIRTEGFGLGVGEECEHLFWMLSHLVRAGRVSSGPRRRQLLDSTLKAIARTYREASGRHLHSRWIRMLDIQQEARKTIMSLASVPQPTGDDFMTESYLLHQLHLQYEHYSKLDEPVEDPRDAVFSLLYQEYSVRLARANEGYTSGPECTEPPLSWAEMENVPKNKVWVNKRNAFWTAMNKVGDSLEDWEFEGEMWKKFCMR